MDDKKEPQAPVDNMVIDADDVTSAVIYAEPGWRSFE